MPVAPPQPVPQPVAAPDSDDDLMGLIGLSATPTPAPMAPPMPVPPAPPVMTPPPAANTLSYDPFKTQAAPPPAAPTLNQASQPVSFDLFSPENVSKSRQKAEKLPKQKKSKGVKDNMTDEQREELGIAKDKPPVNMGLLIVLGIAVVGFVVYHFFLS